MNRKIIASVMSLLMLCSGLTACGKKTSAPAAPAPTEAVSTPAPTPSPEPTPSPTPIPTPTPSPEPTIDPNVPIITVEDETVPDNIIQGKVVDLLGIIKCDKGYISEVRGYILREDGTIVQECIYNNDGRSFGLAGTVNASLMFAGLNEGAYIYKVVATAISGSCTNTVTVIDHRFNVLAPGSSIPAAVTPAPTVIPTSSPVYDAQSTPDAASMQSEAPAVRPAVSDNETIIWNKLMDKLDNPCGAAGVLAGISIESGCVSQRVEGDFSSGCSYSITYTAAVDRGEISKEAFVSERPGPQYGLGYGLCQWSGEHKRELCEYAAYCAVSVGDLEMQCDFLLRELESEYPVLFEYLKNSADPEEAAAEFRSEYEQTLTDGGHAAKARAYFEKLG